MTTATQDRRALPGLYQDKPRQWLYNRTIEILRVRQSSRPTEEVYVPWLRGYIEFRPHRNSRPRADGDVCRRAVKKGVRTAGLTRRVTSHLFRHSFVTQLLVDGYDIRGVQDVPGHKVVRTTMIDTHVLNRGGRGVRSPADGLNRTPDAR